MSGSADALGLPFEEAIAFFRRKLSVQTPRWNTLRRDQHAAAFTVAGAMAADLLADLRAAVDKAIADGGTLQEFRRDFDAIVQRHGWRHKGKPGWRARTIFETNLRTAYAAGSWQQAQESKAERPFLRYSAILDNRTRPQHRAWHGTILPIDHPFWRTHYPPNGWGCRCSVITLSQAQLDARGWKVTDPAPLSGGVPRRVRQPDGTDRIEEVPPGVDPAWAYNVGEASQRWRAAKLANDKLADMPAHLAAVVWASAVRATGESSARRTDTAAEFRAWAERLVAAPGPTGEARVIGALSPRTVQRLEEVSAAGTIQGFTPPLTAAVGIDSNRLWRLVGKDNRAPDQLLPLDDILRLPDLVASPAAVLLERSTGTLLLVFAPTGTDPRAGKLVVRLDYVTRDQRQKVRFNAVISGGLVSRDTLDDPAAYILLDGSLR